jgi:hypothetical protein
MYLILVCNILKCTLQNNIIRDTIIEKDRLLVIQEGLCGFIMGQVINPQGRNHYDDHQIDNF